MRQLTQKLKNGRPEVIEVPVPLVGGGMLLVQNAYSVISAGTEGSTVKAARKSLLGKARERPKQAKQMIDLLDVLKAKTAGNLTAGEAAVLDDLLFDLRMRYLEAVGRA